jgi:hypothetical protein
MVYNLAGDYLQAPRWSSMYYNYKPALISISLKASLKTSLDPLSFYTIYLLTHIAQS